MKIFGWLADHAGCGWYRIVLPLGHLRDGLGHDVRWGRRMEEADSDGADVIIAQRTFMPGPTQRFQKLVNAKGRNYKVVLELDDDLWSVESHNRSAQVFSIPEVRANLTLNARTADLVTVSTEPLAGVIRRFNPNVVVLPNSIPSDMLSWRSGRHEDRVTIGWQGGPTHDLDWEPLVQPLTRWFRQHNAYKVSAGLAPPIELHTVGRIPEHTDRCRPDCEKMHFPEVYPHRHTPWSEGIGDYYRSLDWHIALAPLRDSKFNRSKSHIRVLEAAMLGFPVVASRVSAYADFVQHGQTGFLVPPSDPKQWAHSLSTLAQDPDLREGMSAAARAHARQYAIEQTGHLWEKAYAA